MTVEDLSALPDAAATGRAPAEAKPLESETSAESGPAIVTNLVDVAANNIVTVEMLAAAVASGAVGGSAGSSAVASSPEAESVLVRVELSESLREDGRLLRMFVARGEHFKPEARQLALKNWLIPGEFYDKWLEVFVARYGQKHVDAANLEDRYMEVADACQRALCSKANIAALEAKLATSGKDVFQLRDLLLTAAKDLSAPRRRLGTHGNTAMPPEAIEALRLQRQVRLRSVVLACLRGIYASGVGGEVLKIATESARSMIDRFEDVEDEVCTARQGNQWHELKVLLDEIGGRKALTDGTPSQLATLTDALDDAEKLKVERSKKEGKGTKFLLEKALEAMGGAATTRELINWVEAHQDFTEAHSSIRLNKNISASISTRKRAEAPIWHSTLMSVLSCHFIGDRRSSKGFVWRSPNSVPALTAKSDADVDEQMLPALPPALVLDAAAEQASAACAVPKPRQRKRRALLDADVVNEAPPGEGATLQKASSAGRGKRKSAKGQQTSTAPVIEDQAVPGAGPDPLALLSVMKHPATLLDVPPHIEELRPARAAPRQQSVASAQEPSGAGPPSKRPRKADVDLAVDPLSLALDAAIAAASAS